MWLGTIFRSICHPRSYEFPKSCFCFQTMTRINSAGTAEPDRRGKPVAGGEWNPLPRDHGQIASPTFLLNKHHPHCHNHVPSAWSCHVHRHHCFEQNCLLKDHSDCHPVIPVTLFSFVLTSWSLSNSSPFPLAVIITPVVLLQEEIVSTLVHIITYTYDISYR